MIDLDMGSDMDEAACSCGSGLRQIRCCGLDLGHVEHVPADGPHADELTEITDAWHSGDRDTVRRLAIAILEVSPGQRDALGALYNVLKDNRQYDAAGTVLDRLATIHVNDPVSRLIAAQYFLARGDKARAQLHARMLVRLAPMSANAHFVMARTFLALDHPDTAEYHIRVAARQSGDGEKPLAPVDIDTTLAIALRDQGRYAEARDIFIRLVAAHGDHIFLLLHWASLEEADRRFDEAIDLIERAERKAPGSPQVALLRALINRRVARPSDALDALSLSSDGDPTALLQKGHILDSMGRHEEAFASYAVAKRVMREETGHGYLSDQASALVAGLTDFFTQGRTALLPRAERRDDSPQPIFIIGFPRSGTTLVEQTLTAHPAIAGGGELPIISGIAERAQMLLGSPQPYPGALSELWLGDRRGLIGTLRDLYLNEAMRMGAIDPAKQWFTDKMPLNETHLALISLLFPQSPIIHLVRHPLDVILSVFANGLTHGFHCAYSLDGAAQHYALIADLIDHYRAIMSLRYHAVRYEELVTDQEGEVRRLLDFIGEPFDARTLAFHDNRRAARTASYAQVTQPLYVTSRYRYRRYLEQLSSIVPIVLPAIGRLGYSVDPLT